MQFQIGQMKIIFSNGGLSLIATLENNELILNIKPSNAETEAPVLQLFVMEKPKG